MNQLENRIIFYFFFMGNEITPQKTCPKYPGMPCHCKQASLHENNPQAKRVSECVAPIAVRINSGDKVGVPIVSPGSLPTRYEGPC